MSLLSVRRRAPLAVLLVAPTLVFLAVFFVYPVATIVGLGFGGDQTPLGPVRQVLSDPGLRGVLWFTVWQAVASTALTLLVGLPLAYVLARYAFAGRRLVRALITVPFVMPTVVVATAFLGLLGPGGVVDLADTIWAVLLAHVFFNLAVVVRTVGGLWGHLDPRLEEAARVLGAGRWQALRTVTLPLLRPALASASSIVFLFTFTSFGVVLILGGPGTTTLEVEIYRQTAQLLDLDVAAALALLQLVAVAAALLAYRRFATRRLVQQRLAAATRTARAVAGWRDRLLVGATLGTTAVLLGAPLLALAVRSVQGSQGWTLRAWRQLAADTRSSTLFVPPLEAVRNSLVFALATTVLAVVLGLLAALAIARRRRRVGRTRVAAAGVETLLMLPLGTSAATVGFGFLVALDTPPLDLRASPVLVPIAHALVALPFVVRTVVPVLEAVDDRLRAAAAVLGAGPGRVWREVDVPLAGRSLLVAAGFAFAVSLGEFGATVFVARAQFPTVPVAIFRYLGQPGADNVAQAMALSVVLMLLVTLAVLAIERLRVGEVGEF